MLLQWLHVVGAFLYVLVIVKSEEEISGVYQKNNYSFIVFGDRFYLQGGPYPVIPEGAIANIPSMEFFQCDDKGISQIKKGAFQNLPNLKEIRIIDTNLTKLEGGVFNGLKLTDLSITLNKSPLSFSSDAFDNLTTLQTLDLHNSKITTWNPNWFKNTPALKKIVMDHNLLEELPAGAFQNLNPDQELTLDFSNNRLRNISDAALRGIRKLKLLDLGHNKLKEFNGNFLTGVTIDELRIAENDIRCIREEDFQKVFKARVITGFSDNPWDPVCLEQIRKWAKANDMGHKI